MGSPTVTPITEIRHAGGYVTWDPSNGTLTRKEILLQSGVGLVTAGLVLAALLTGGAAVAAALGTNTGNGTFSAITAGSAAKAGAYTVQFIDATRFILNDPTGVEVGHGVAGTALTAGGLTFTITAGGTAFAPADSFTITVTGTAKYVGWDPTASNGAQVVAGILWSERRDATSADRKAVANVRGPMRVNPRELVWGTNVTTTQQQAAGLAGLEKLGILSA